MTIKNSSVSVETIKYIYKDVLETLSYYEFENELFIGLIQIKKEFRGLGHGTKIMEALCLYADSNRLMMTLTPLYQDGVSANDISDNKPLFNLEDFYSRKFRFILNDGENELPHIKDRMYRKVSFPYVKNNKIPKGNKRNSHLEEDYF